MERLGAEKKRLTAKIAGGAKMFETGEAGMGNRGAECGISEKDAG